MALTENTKQLIECVQKSDLYAAKKAAMECVKEDTTQKNKPWCDRYEKLLSNTPTVLELPPNIKYKAHLEDVTETFIEDRYYLSDKSIIKTQYFFTDRLELAKPPSENMLLTKWDSPFYI